MMRTSTKTKLSARRRAPADCILCAFTAAFAGVLAGCQQPNSTSERACSESQAIDVANLTGKSLPAKTLALTFDDGPGARTSELSTYLRNEGISAGFFVNGKMIHGTTVLAQIIADGHVIGNHTQTHASLTGRATGSWHLDDATTVSELAQTDVLIAPFVTADRFMFRAPYGDFDNASAAAINASSMSKYAGPIYWNIGNNMGPHQAADWDCWSAGNDGVVLTTTRCGDLYVEEIDAVGKGVVLMHDPYFIGGNPANGGTVDMVQYIVPILKAKGYSFVRIDEVPEIASVLPPLPVPSSPPAAAPSSGSGGMRAVGSSSGTHHGWATTDGNTGAGDASPAHGLVTPGTDPSAGAGESASTSGGKPDPCASSPQRKPAN